MEIDITRLLEFADEINRREQDPLHGRGIAWIGTQIAVPFAAGEQRRIAAQVDDQVASCAGAVAAGLEA